MLDNSASKAGKMGFKNKIKINTGTKKNIFLGSRALDPELLTRAPAARNIFSSGSTTLHNQYGTLEVCQHVVPEPGVGVALECAAGAAVAEPGPGHRAAAAPPTSATPPSSSSSSLKYHTRFII